ncbi:MAG: DUF4340 domain-containing protein [Xanthomonadales bacterium]|nr:DUF4340 domain-containing protein [Xanthomonadales bacterium]
MNRNTLLLGAAVVFLALGWYLSRDNAGSSADHQDQPLLPAVAADVNQVSGFTLSQAGGEVIADIDRVDDRWVVSSSSGYPADVSKVRKFLLAIKDAQKREERTSKPEKYAEIGVDDPAGSDAKGALLTVKGVAEPNQLIIGNFASGGGEYTYVRVVGEERSWLANGNLVPERSVSNWLQRDILDVPSNRIARVEITAPDGEKLAISKADEVAPNYEVENVPKGRELSSPSAGNILASALGSLQLEEVLPAADAAPVEDAAFQIRYYTREGLTIDATTWMQDEKHYARFVAAVDPDLVAAWSTAEQARQAAAQPPAADESADSDQPASESVVPDLATISAEQQSKMEAEAGQINAIASDWTFIIPSWKYANMAKRMDELLATKE